METKNNNAFTPFRAVHPNIGLEMELEARGIKQKDFAKQIGLYPANLNRIIKGKAPITETIAEKLEQALGTKAYLWVALQKEYEQDSVIIALREKAKKTAANPPDILFQTSYIEV